MLGEVLCVQGTIGSRTHPAARCSAVYLTWLLRPQALGCICRLQIDEADTSDIVELEDIWLPILAGLQRTVDAEPDQRPRSDRRRPFSDPA